MISYAGVEICDPCSLSECGVPSTNDGKSPTTHIWSMVRSEMEN